MITSIINEIKISRYLIEVVYILLNNHCCLILDCQLMFIINRVDTW